MGDVDSVKSVEGKVKQAAELTQAAELKQAAELTQPKESIRHVEYVLPPPCQPTVFVAGTNALFPVRRIYCVGRNFAGHAREMGADPEKEPPFFFTKPAGAVVPLWSNRSSCANSSEHSNSSSSSLSDDHNGIDVNHPPSTNNLQHEVEMVVAIGLDGADIPLEKAREHIFGYAVGLDMTRRDIQIKLREQSRPWDMAKAFDQSAPIGIIYPVAQVGHLERGAIWLKVNGTERQHSDLAQMIWSVPEIIANLSKYVRLCAGDLIYTGTPEGVSKVVRGDTLQCGVEGLGELLVTIV